MTNLITTPNIRREMINVKGKYRTGKNKNNELTRYSLFRGVSKNGSKFQTLIMVNRKKKYAGTFKSEEEAARRYDKVALQYHGTKAKTNFQYSQDEVEEILKDPIILSDNTLPRDEKFK
jgi:hypothetical protein